MSLSPLASERNQAEQAYNGLLEALYAVEAVSMHPDDNTARARHREVIVRAADAAEALMGNLKHLEAEIAANRGEVRS